jgi:HK97 family phage prohead protease
MQLETRDLTLFGIDPSELRFGEEETPNRFVGLIPFGTLSVDLGGFKERIAPSAFTTTIKGGSDVRALVDHDPSKLLGRSSNSTLRVLETAAGLAVEIDVPNTSYANDLCELVKRRDVRGLSFGFKVREGGQRFVKEGGLTIRELTDIDLREVSVVSSPAYHDTTVSIRSAEIDAAIAALLKPVQIFPKILSAKSAWLRHMMK